MSAINQRSWTTGLLVVKHHGAINENISYFEASTWNAGQAEQCSGLELWCRGIMTGLCMITMPTATYHLCFPLNPCSGSLCKQYPHFRFPLPFSIDLPSTNVLAAGNICHTGQCLRSTLTDRHVRCLSSWRFSGYLSMQVRQGCLRISLINWIRRD